MAGTLHQRGLLQLFSGALTLLRVLTWAGRVQPMLCTRGIRHPVTEGSICSSCLAGVQLQRIS
jgi:hypothetical protein